MARRHLISLLAALAALVAPSASTAGGIGAFTFSATPASAKNGASLGYFKFVLAPGRSGHGKIVVSNASSQPVTLKVSSSSGTTAQGSGSAYVTGRSNCQESACWIHGLPTALRLGAHSRRALTFTVHVPAGTRTRQYLAGITVEPATASPAIRVQSGKGVGARAVVIHQVNVGVEFTVGSITAMRTRLQIVRVVSVALDDVARLVVYERNVGDTFLKAAGQAICLAGKTRYAYPVSSDLVLPGDTTTLAVNTPGLPSGASLSCRVFLNYTGAAGRGAAPAAWRGTIRIPKLTKPHIVQTGPGSYAQVPKAHVPKWAIALIAGGGALVLVLLVVIVVLLRRRPSPAT